MIAIAATNLTFNGIQVDVDGQLKFRSTAKSIDLTNFVLLAIPTQTHRITVKVPLIVETGRIRSPEGCDINSAGCHIDHR